MAQGHVELPRRAGRLAHRPTAHPTPAMGRPAMVLLVALLALLPGSKSTAFENMLPALVPESLRCSLCRTADLAGSRVPDCACDFATVDSATHAYYHPLLARLQRTSCFRFFKVNLDEECPFWEDHDALCALKDCAVETCDPEQIPPPFWMQDEAEEASHHRGSAGSAGAAGRTAAVPSNRSDVTVAQDLKSRACGEAGEAAGPSQHEQDQRLFEQVKRVDLRQGALELPRWSEGQSDDVWIEQDEASGMVYVDLLENPERYTGYTGPSARRVWAAIHEENCFEGTSSFGGSFGGGGGGGGGGGQCLEKRVFYRLMSGLQASISTHIANQFFFGGGYGEDGYWAPNTPLFVERVGKHPDRLQNLYFAYLFVLRALAKAAPEVESHACLTGNPGDDNKAQALLRALVRPEHPLLDDAATSAAAVCQRGFDETRLFQASGRSDFLSDLDRFQLRAEFQSRFRNISRIMDCVGCEKCRLWGKLQVLGIGTALKILMSPEDRGLSLQRNEVIALLNTLAQLSTSVQSVKLWRNRELRTALTELAARIGLALSLLLVVSLLLRRRKNRKPPAPAEAE